MAGNKKISLTDLLSPKRCCPGGGCCGSGTKKDQASNGSKKK